MTPFRTGPLCGRRGGNTREEREYRPKYLEWACGPRGESLWPRWAGMGVGWESIPRGLFIAGRARLCGLGGGVAPGGVFVDQALLGDFGCEGGGWRGEDFWMVWTVVQRKGCISGHLSLLLWTVVFMVEFNQ